MRTRPPSGEHRLPLGVWTHEQDAGLTMVEDVGKTGRAAISALGEVPTLTKPYRTEPTLISRAGPHLSVRHFP